MEHERDLDPSLEHKTGFAAVLVSAGYLFDSVLARSWRDVDATDNWKRELPNMEGEGLKRQGCTQLSMPPYAQSNTTTPTDGMCVPLIPA